VSRPHARRTRVCPAAKTRCANISVTICCRCHRRAQRPNHTTMPGNDRYSPWVVRSIGRVAAFDPVSLNTRASACSLGTAVVMAGAQGEGGRPELASPAACRDPNGYAKLLHARAGAGTSLPAQAPSIVVRALETSGSSGFFRADLGLVRSVPDRATAARHAARLIAAYGWCSINRQPVPCSRPSAEDANSPRR
jgi:hypothetical protein